MYLLILTLVLISFLVEGLGFATNYSNEVMKIVDGVSNKNSTSPNANCMDQLSLFLGNLENATGDDIWALRMIDASFKVPAGVLEFNVAWAGRYEQCLKIESNNVDVKGKYCLATISVKKASSDETVAQTSAMLGLQESPIEISHFYKYLKSSQSDSASAQLPFLPSIALCIPHNCADYELQDILSGIVPSIPLNVTCQVKEDLGAKIKGDLGAIMTISFFGVFIVLMITSTVYDMRAVKDNRKPHPLLIVFSVYTNGQKLFKISHNPSEFSSLHGIRFISMVWVVYGHSLYVSLFGPLVNTLDVLRYLGKKESMIFSNAPLCVDTFFVLTGMLVVYSFMKAKKFNIIGFYVHRYLRLTPPIIPAILVSAFLTEYLGSGPYYPQVYATVSEPCKGINGWKTILYIKTLLGLASTEELSNFCIVQTWYLNVDWQLYVISPIFLLLLPKYPKISLSIMLCAMLASMGAAFWATWHFQIPALITNIYKSQLNYNKYYYFQTYTRASTWFIGGFLGYILAKLKLENQLISFKIPKWLVITIWTIVLAVIPTCIFAGHDRLFTQTYYFYSSAFWNTFTRPAWALCVAWIIFACAIGYGGIINSILSWPPFQVLARFTYSIYLVHLNILLIMSYSQKQPGYFSLFDVGMRFWSGFTFSFAVSIFWVLAFESPVLAFEKYLLGRVNAKSTNAQNKALS